MQVYKILKSCSISYIENGVNVKIALYEGDYFFIDRDSHWVYDQISDIYIKQSVLVKIFYNKLKNFNGDYEWTWITNINIVDPKLSGVDMNDKYFILSAEHFDNSTSCKNITVQWERNEKLKQLTENN